MWQTVPGVELLLWPWSVGVQFTSLAMIAVFSVGTAGLEAGGAPDAALHAADKAMYEAKSARACAPA